MEHRRPLDLNPVAPRQKAKIAFVTDGGAISYAEQCGGLQAGRSRRRGDRWHKRRHQPVYTSRWVLNLLDWYDGKHALWSRHHGVGIFADGAGLTDNQGRRRGARRAARPCHRDRERRELMHIDHELWSIPYKTTLTMNRHLHCPVATRAPEKVGVSGLVATRSGRDGLLG